LAESWSAADPREATSWRKPLVADLTCPPSAFYVTAELQRELSATFFLSSRDSRALEKENTLHGARDIF